ncbi:MAG TPA: efflux RND transporter periplasmic adaptor subunit [Luteibacter sp.]|uniref:efflux RND transporter periplasmic adaptor subunit n=1 Tax=Luteibacter sp. TaxID=1886636 RepID=UPI002CD28760|nr:efflux RND transporter periplasmic adaptor subunit [Luteibacter sp.]HVI53783.1 efflux RND transporter periplasmic adaptor subunit [Luteibacter sp.]
MNRLLLSLVVATICAGLAACGGRADADGAGLTPSAVIRQIMPARGSVDDVIVSYGQGAAGRGGSRVLTLPLDVTLTGVDVVVGQHVRAGQRLAVFAPSKAAVAARVAARSSVTVAQEQRDRVARLLGDRLATNDQLAQADKALHDAEAALAAQDTPDNVLRAPEDGTVLGIEAQRGALVTAGAALMAFAEDARIGFAGGIEPADMLKVHAGDAVALHALSGGVALGGRVTAVAGVVDPVSRLVEVRVAASSPLVQGAAYRAEIVVGVREGWRTPADAVVGDDDARAVWQIVQGKAHRVVVTVVAQRGDEALVEGPIDASHALVTVGAAQLDEGMQVRPAGSR